MGGLYLAMAQIIGSRPKAKFNQVCKIGLSPTGSSYFLTRA